MSEPRLIYFNARAQVELLRFVAAVGGVKTVDERVSIDDWEKFKSQTPYGQLPCLVIDNKWYAQRLAIAYYLAKKGGLYPTSGDELETLKYDHVLLFTDEILEDMLKGFRARWFQKSLETLEKAKTEILPKKLPILERILKDNGTGYMVGNKLSIVDLSVFDILEHVVDIAGEPYLAPYPQLKALFQRVGQLEAIKKHIASRPSMQGGFDF